MQCPKEIGPFEGRIFRLATSWWPTHLTLASDALARPARVHANIGLFVSVDMSIRPIEVTGGKTQTANFFTMSWSGWIRFGAYVNFLTHVVCFSGFGLQTTRDACALPVKTQVTREEE